MGLGRYCLGPGPVDVTGWPTRDHDEAAMVNGVTCLR